MSFDRDDALQLIHQRLDATGETWEIEQIDQETRIGQQTPGWAFTARRLIPGAFGEGDTAHGYLDPTGDINLDA